MAFIEYAVTELAEPLKIEDSVIAYAERQMGPQRNTALHAVHRARALGSANLTRELLLQRDRFCWRSLRQPERSRVHRPVRHRRRLGNATAPGTEMFKVVDGPVDPDSRQRPGVPGIVAGDRDRHLGSEVNEDL